VLDQGEWLDELPPRPRRGKSKWDPVVAALKAKPGKAIRYHDQSRGIPNWLRKRYPGLVVESFGHHRNADGKSRCDMDLWWPKELKT
jgi:hypothetical protein